MVKCETVKTDRIIILRCMVPRPCTLHRIRDTRRLCAFSAMQGPTRTREPCMASRPCTVHVRMDTRRLSAFSATQEQTRTRKPYMVSQPCTLRLNRLSRDTWRRCISSAVQGLPRTMPRRFCTALHAASQYGQNAVQSAAQSAAPRSDDSESRNAHQVDCLARALICIISLSIYIYICYSIPLSLSIYIYIYINKKHIYIYICIHISLRRALARQSREHPSSRGPLGGLPLTLVSY